MDKHKALIQIHIAAFLFGLSGIFADIIQTSVYMISVGRSFFAVLILTLICFRHRIIPWHISLKAFYGVFAAGALLTAHWITFFLGIKIGNVAVATLGFACFPAVVVLLEALFFKDRITKTEYLLIIFVSLGLILVTPAFEFGNTATLGLLWGILSGVLYAGTAVLSRYNTNNTSSIQTSWWQCLVVFLILIPFNTHALPSVTTTDWFWLICLGIFSTGLSTLLFINTIAVLNARTASIVIALEPVYAIAIAWLLFNQDVSLRTIIGGAIIIIAVIWSGTRSKPSSH